MLLRLFIGLSNGDNTHVQECMCVCTHTHTNASTYIDLAEFPWVISSNSMILDVGNADNFYT